MDPISKDWCLYKRRERGRGYRNAHEEEGHAMMEAEIRMMQLQAKEQSRLPEKHQKLGRGKEKFFLGAFRGSIALIAPLVWTSSLQNFE